MILNFRTSLKFAVTALLLFLTGALQTATAQSPAMLKAQHARSDCNRAYWNAAADVVASADVVVGARPDDAAERLARAAFEKGSTDNITAVVVELPSTPAARSEPEAEAE